MKNTVGKHYWLGIDVAKATFDVSLVYHGHDPYDWRSLPVAHIAHPPGSDEGRVSLTAWLQRLRPEGECRGICVESTGSHSLRCAESLAETDLPPVSIVNPKFVKDYGGSLGIKNKTDRIDAALLALYGVYYRPAPRILLSPEEQSLKDLNRLREAIVKDITSWKNRLQEAMSPSARSAIKDILQGCIAEQRRIEDQLDTIVATIPRLRKQREILETIHGYGRVLAHTLTAEKGLLTSYTRNELVASVGMYPVAYESGTSVRRPPHLARGGGGRIRRVLYMGAVSIINHPHSYEPFIRRLRKKGKCDMSILGAIMRKMLLVGRAVMKNGGVYEERRIGASSSVGVALS